MQTPGNPCSGLSLHSLHLLSHNPRLTKIFIEQIRSPHVVSDPVGAVGEGAEHMKMGKIRHCLQKNLQSGKEATTVHKPFEFSARGAQLEQLLEFRKRVLSQRGCCQVFLHFLPGALQ